MKLNHRLSRMNRDEMVRKRTARQIPYSFRKKKQKSWRGQVRAYSRQ